MGRFKIRAGSADGLKSVSKWSPMFGDIVNGLNYAGTSYIFFNLNPLYFWMHGGRTQVRHRIQWAFKDILNGLKSVFGNHLRLKSVGTLLARRISFPIWVRWTFASTEDGLKSDIVSE